MRDIVIVPTYFRPEYLTLCLEHIEAARKGRELEVRVYHDARKVAYVNAQDTQEVCNRFGYPYLTIRKPHNAVGNTLNFLGAYADAFVSDARLVYLIEDDVLVGTDFFDWHEAIQARRDYLCSVGWHCIRNPEVKPSTDPNAFIESAVDFSSIGVCWKREALPPVVLHADPAYYTNPSAYLAKQFPGSPIPPNRWVEQAGLIMRVLLAGQGKRIVAWPAVPRCAHIGISGYHRSKGPQFTGNLDQKIQQLRTALSSGQLAEMGRSIFDDINTPIPAQDWKAEDFYVSQTF